MTSFDQIVSAPPGRFDGIERPYAPTTSLRLRGSVPIEHSLARRGALKLWELLQAATSRCGRWARSPATRRCRWSAPGSRRSICRAGRPRPTPTPPAPCIPTSRSIRPTPGPSWRGGSTARCSAPTRSSMRRAARKRDWFAPIVADAEAGFGGPLNCFEIMKAYIEAGVAGVHFEDQLASREEVRPSGRQGADPDPGRDPQPRRGAAGGRRLRRADRPRRPHRRRERQADHLATSTSATAQFLTGERTPEGFFRLKEGTGLDHCIARGLAFAPHADLLWWETSHPDLDDARTFAEAVHAAISGQAARL